MKLSKKSRAGLNENILYMLSNISAENAKEIKMIKNDLPSIKNPIKQFQLVKQADMKNEMASPAKKKK